MNKRDVVSYVLTNFNHEELEEVELFTEKCAQVVIDEIFPNTT